jgi:hypothetical protein
MHAVPQCRYDQEAFGRTVDMREYFAADLNHFSIAGHTEAAAVAWKAMQRTGVLPESGRNPASPALSTLW